MKKMWISMDWTQKRDLIVRAERKSTSSELMMSGLVVCEGFWVKLPSIDCTLDQRREVSKHKSYCFCFIIW
jgi:hypothetical protein